MRCGDTGYRHETTQHWSEPSPPATAAPGKIFLWFLLQYFPAFGNVLLQTATFLHTAVPDDDEYDYWFVLCWAHLLGLKVCEVLNVATLTVRTNNNWELTSSREMTSRNIQFFLLLSSILHNVICSDTKPDTIYLPYSETEDVDFTIAIPGNKGCYQW